MALSYAIRWIYAFREMRSDIGFDDLVDGLTPLCHAIVGRIGMAGVREFDGVMVVRAAAKRAFCFCCLAAS